MPLSTSLPVVEQCGGYFRSFSVGKDGTKEVQRENRNSSLQSSTKTVATFIKIAPKASEHLLLKIYIFVIVSQ